MAHEYVESERRSRRRRGSPRVLPPAPELDDWARTDDVYQDSPPRRPTRGKEEIIRSDSRASTTAASSQQQHHHRRRRSTPSHSLSSSASMRAAHPPLSSLTRPLTVPYRRPTTKAPPSAYDDEDICRSDGRRSRSRRDMSSGSAHRYQSTPRSRRSSRSSESESDTETELTFDSQAERHARREDRIAHVNREERGWEDRGRDYRRQRRHGHMTPEEEYDERDRHSRRHSRHRALSPEDERSPSRHSYDRHDDHEDPGPRERRDRHHEHRGHHKYRHSSRSRDHRRVRSDIIAKSPSTPPKRRVLKAVFEGTPDSRTRPAKKYYESEVITTEKHAPSIRRSSTTGGSQVATSQQSVSSSAKRPSSTFLGKVFFGPSLHAHPSDRPVKTVECVVCMDDLSSKKTSKLKCGHRMCQNCLKRSFKLSITDPQHMPPKCCTTDNIPLKHVDRLFDVDFKKNWNKKFVEYSTRNRIYCPSKRCNEFIKPENINHRPEDGRKFGKCGKCKTKVCVLCNGKWHSSRECPKDEEMAQLLAQAKDEGWQRCFRCKAMVELKEGCNHMTCRCGAEFCMCCGSRWKSCECPWFSYDTVENDRLQHMQLPQGVARERFGVGGHEEPPPHPRESRGGGGQSHPMHLGRPHPQYSQNYEEDTILRQLQEDRDEALARRLQTHDLYNDDDLVMRPETIAFGNQAGHFMNDDYRRRPQNIAVSAPLPQPGPIPLDPPPPFERPNAGADYISGVNRARGVPRAASFERRLADRFNTETRQSPIGHRTGPPQLQTSVTMPIMHTPGPPPPATAPVVRTNIMGDDMYNSKQAARSTRSAERVTPPRIRHVYTEDDDVVAAAAAAAPVKVSSRKQHVIQEPPKSSVMAGLTGPGRGMNRVSEWRIHVEPGVPEGDAAVVT